MLTRVHFYKGVLMQNMTDLAKAHVEQFKVTLNNLESHTGELKEKTILDIGCGRFYSYALLSLGKRNTVIGIDKDYIGYNTSSVLRWGVYMIVWK